MSKTTIILVILIILLLAGDIFLGIEYYLTNVQYQKVLSTSRVNTSVLTLDKLFVAKVLENQGVVSDEDRLKLENAAVGTNDSVIIDGWHSFLDSTTQEDAQARVLTLLSLFPDKIIY
jgi:hypothetical protein